MHTRNWLRRRITSILLNQPQLALTGAPFDLAPRFQGIQDLGLYLHIPFCRQICPYCPYNKELYRPAVAQAYTQAVLREIDRYAPLVGRLPVTSFYIGGGTPTTMLRAGLAAILEHIGRSFNMQCGIHLESHPADLTPANLADIRAMGVDHLSMGVEALQDRHLRALCRPYTAAQALAAVERAVSQGFTCVNVDLIFALPHQTHAELSQAAGALIELGVHQVAAYPLFSFPYTRWPRLAQHHRYPRYNLLQKRHMLRVLEGAFYAAGYQRTSVWAFTRPDSPSYCSVTVPLYLGLGASAASYLRDIFYLNTFDTQEYVRALADGRMPIALSLELSARMQMAGWLYWRIYQTRFKKSDFESRFHQAFDAVYGRYLGLFSWLGLLVERGDEIILTDAGAYWLHALQDFFSIGYVSTLWGTSNQAPWPAQVIL